MPAAHRPLATDHPADASSASTDGETDSSDPTRLERPDAPAGPASSTDGLTRPGPTLETELECARLRARVLELEAALRERDRERQDLIDRYESLLAARDRSGPVRRQSFESGVGTRLRRALSSLRG